MVPMSKKALKSPKSRKATESNGTRAKKAPTVVTFPTTSGVTISFKAERVSV